MASMPSARGRPMIGPSPSIAVTPSTMEKCGPDGCVQVDDGVRDAVDVQQVLRPAIHGAWHDAEEVLHARGETGPVVGLQLRHRHDDVGLQQFDRERKLLQPRETARQRHARDIVVIQIDEADSQIGQDVGQTGGGEQVLDVPAVSGPLADDHFPRARPQEGLGGAGHDTRVAC